MPPGVVAFAGALADELADAGATVAPIVDVAQVDAAIGALRADGAAPVFVIGVGAAACDAFLQAAREDVAGVVGIDGRPPVEEARAGRFRAPVVAVYAEDTGADAEAFAAALAEHGVMQETVVYDGIGEGFFERGDAPEAIADARRVTLRFMGLGAR